MSDDPRIEALIQSMIAVAEGNFDVAVEGSEANDAIDSLILGFSMMADDLRERAAELNEARLAAERANRAKDEFLANMSHEIRTPLNSVIGFGEILETTSLNPDQRRFVESMRKSGEELLALINDILDFSKLGSEQTTLDAIPFDLRLTLENVADAVAPSASSKGVDVVVDYPLSVPRWVIGDPHRVRQILLNLAANGVKFTDTGHVLLRANYAEGSASFELLVEDTGVGLDEHEVESLFRPFVQGDGSSTRRFGGTGLGLAIASQLASLMGGKVSYRATPRPGSTFVFEVPLSLHPGRRDEIPLAPGLEHVRVLIVDDNPLNCQVLHEQITAWGMRNGHFASGEAALRALREAHQAGDPYQIAVVDYQMPGIDGHELGTLIKADRDLRDTVLIMLTSMSRPGDATTIAGAGFSAYLVKPVHQSRLLDALQQAWSAHTGGVDAGLTTVHTLPERRDASDGEVGSAAVLVVEDNEVNQMVATEFLELFGHHATCASNGREGIAAMRREKFDLVLMDVQMPVLGGLEAIAEIRRDPSLCDTIVVAMTAHALEGDREAFLAAGMNDHIAKPLSREPFEALLSRWLKKRRC